MANVPAQQRRHLGRARCPEPRKAASGQSSKEFLKAWKIKSDEHAEVMFMSIWIDGPAVSGALKQAAIDAVMRAVWSRVDAPDKEKLLRENWDEIEKYTADLVDKTVSERWTRVTAR